MKQRSLTAMAALVLFVGGFLPGVAGCDREVAGQVATFSGAYVGDVVTVAVTGYLYDALGIEDSGSLDEHSDEGEHSHEAEPLHDHEH